MSTLRRGARPIPVLTSIGDVCRQRLLQNVIARCKFYAGHKIILASSVFGNFSIDERGTISSSRCAATICASFNDWMPDACWLRWFPLAGLDRFERITASRKSICHDVLTGVVRCCLLSVSLIFCSLFFLAVRFGIFSDLSQCYLHGVAHSAGLAVAGSLSRIQCACRRYAC